MSNNKTATDQIHNALNAYFNTRENPNWKALVEAIGESDQSIADLIKEVRKQFFVSTASRPYLDRLAANYSVSRPKVVGMDDVTLRKYVPILAYKPKQVKSVIDDLLDIFFFKESTTAFSSSLSHAPFIMKDGWELEYTVDGVYDEKIIFSSLDFNDLNNVTADEIASAINRQAKYSFAVSFLDKITKNNYLRLFTKTIGSKGSIEVTGGRSDISLQFLGFISASGSGPDTVWEITKVGDTMRFTYDSGAGVNLFQVAAGDKVLIDVPNNSGTFVVSNVNISEEYFEFQNLSGTATDAGSGYDTVWEITKVGDTMRFTYLSGTDVKLFQVEVGYNVLIDIPGNSGKFVVSNVNVSEGYFEFNNPFGTPGIFDHGANPGYYVKFIKTFNHGINPGYYVRFIRPERSVVYTRDNRSIVWEVEPGKIVIEMASTPPVVRRNLKGSAHLNGPIANMLERVSDTSIKVDLAEDWPNAGQFVLRPLEEVQNKVDVAKITMLEIDTEFDIRNQRYSYASKTSVSGGFVLSGISPQLPTESGVMDLEIDSIESNSSGILTVSTVEPHHIKYDGSVMIYGITPTPDPMNGVFQITEIVDEYTFKCQSSSDEMPSRSQGFVRIERVGLANAGSQVYLTSSIIDTGIYGPYMYDTSSPFIVAGYTAKTSQSITSGSIVLNLQLQTPNSIPNEQGYLIFDYGLNTQEGPVRYLYKASEGTLALDPAYIFKYNHTVGSTITAIRRKGSYVLGGLGKEYAFYISDPSMARQILQDLISKVKSAGVFLEYIIRYPQLYYSDFDIYSKTDENSVLLGLSD